MQVWPVRIVIQRPAPDPSPTPGPLPCSSPSPASGFPRRFNVGRSGSSAPLTSGSEGDRRRSGSSAAETVVPAPAAPTPVHRCSFRRLALSSSSALSSKLRPRAPTHLHLRHRPLLQRGHFLRRLRLERPHRQPPIVVRSLARVLDMPRIRQLQRPVIHPRPFHLQTPSPSPAQTAPAAPGRAPHPQACR